MTQDVTHDIALDPVVEISAELVAEHGLSETEYRRVCALILFISARFRSARARLYSVIR